MSKTWTIIVFLGVIAPILSEDKCKNMFDKFVRCVNISSNDLVTEINNYAAHNNVNFTNLLEIQNIGFENKTLQLGWLDGIQLGFTEFYIQDSDLETVQADAFNGEPFFEVTDLEFTGIPNLTIRNGAFNGINLSKLTIMSSGGALTIEKNTLPESLELLRVVSVATPNLILNVTGPETNLPNLVEMYVSYGKLELLDSDNFVGAPNLKVLYLDENAITSIKANAFDSNTKLERLSLDGNKFTTLPVDLFPEGVTGISIDGNPLDCNCDLLWLRDLFRYHSDKFTAKYFLCHVVGVGYVPYHHIEFCSDERANIN